MPKNLIGHTQCVHCGHDGAEVGLDKKGNPYSVCILGECAGAQHFTHGQPARVKNLLTKTRAVAGVDLHAIAAKFNVQLPGAAPPAPSPVPAREDPQPAAKSGFFGRK